MAKKFIFGTYTIPQKLRFLAEEYHRHHMGTHIQVAMLYRVSRSADGSGGTEWLLTRYHDAQNHAYSSLSLIHADGHGKEYMDEYYYCPRNGENAMIEDWKRMMEVEDDAAD